MVSLGQCCPEAVQISRASQVSFSADEKPAVLHPSVACLLIHGCDGCTAVEKQHICREPEHTAHIQFLDSSSASNETGGEHGDTHTKPLLPPSSLP